MFIDALLFFPVGVLLLPVGHGGEGKKGVPVWVAAGRLARNFSLCCSDAAARGHRCEAPSSFHGGN
jgi:hypothetical protein